MLMPNRAYKQKQVLPSQTAATTTITTTTATATTK